RSTPWGATSFDVHATPAVTVHMIHSPTTKPTVDSRGKAMAKPLGWIFISCYVELLGLEQLQGDEVRRVWGHGAEEEPKTAPRAHPLPVASSPLAVPEVSLDVDWSRSGRVKSKGKDKAKWTWGPDGQGAVLLVNCDRDSPGAGGTDSGQADIRTLADLQDMSVMLLRTQGPSAIFAEYRVVLHVPESDADKVRVFHAVRGDARPLYKPVLGPDKLSYVLEHAGHGDSTFYVEGLAFPDRGFSGLVSFSASLLELPHKVRGVGPTQPPADPPCWGSQTLFCLCQDSPGTPIFTDTVVFRVAPWIMTPNTQQPLEVFVCSGLGWALPGSPHFLPHPPHIPGGDSYHPPEPSSSSFPQDELEFGYVEAPHKTFPVVFDSPRNRGLKDFAFKKILGPDFGYVTREPPGKSVTSLDSFGNLDVSPPVTVRGKEYPLGRILIGSPLPWASGRRMCRAVRDFLFAQKVQAPLEVYSEWLSVGHVDEFLTFVPALDRKGFRLLLASPNACYKLFKEKQQQGHGEATQFIGLKGTEKKSIDEILADESLRSDNRHVQRCIDWNRDLLKQELGLSEQDIVDIPQLFILTGSRADALFPDMVNMLVLGRHLGIPKPFGPVVGGRCCLEQRVRELLEPLGLSCTFIDDFFSYHVLSGDVHCGTNVRRKPFAFKWWHVVP
ncbi:PADI1 deiminase, partial [Pomatorhinus ruficollis]|nr:PADI1 deiminase [Pomatorhinus ruficollis]